MTQPYREVMDYLYARLPMYQRVGPPALKKDLTNTLALLEALGHPEIRFPAIHIAGTNGKGSVAHLLGSLCMVNGLKTGIYTSPHYLDFRERIKIGADYIAEEDVVAFVDLCRPVIEEIEPSFFEVTVAMAFWHFARQQVDMAVVETGLGGRLDSTNVLTPLLSVITNIGWDHMNMLGDSLPAIAGEKAGIIKPHTPVIIGERQPETEPVFRQRAAEAAAPIFFAEEVVTCEIIAETWEGMTVRLGSPGREPGDYLTDLSGPYQARNVRTFLAAAGVLEQLDVLKADKVHLAEALHDVRGRTGLMGRWQVLGTEPLILCDSAHNVDGLRLLFERLREDKEGELHVVFGTVSDKDLSRVLGILPRSASYYLARPDIPRGMDVEVLAGWLEEAGLPHQECASVADAFNAACAHAEPKDRVVVCGSIFVVAEVLAMQDRFSV